MDAAIFAYLCTGMILGVRAVYRLYNAVVHDVYFKGMPDKVKKSIPELQSILRDAEEDIPGIAPVLLTLLAAIIWVHAVLAWPAFLFKKSGKAT